MKYNHNYDYEYVQNLLSERYSKTFNDFEDNEEDEDDEKNKEKNCYINIKSLNLENKDKNENLDYNLNQIDFEILLRLDCFTVDELIKFINETNCEIDKLLNDENSKIRNLMHKITIESCDKKQDLICKIFNTFNNRKDLVLQQLQIKQLLVFMSRTLS